MRVYVDNRERRSWFRLDDAINRNMNVEQKLAQMRVFQPLKRVPRRPHRADTQDPRD
jgi:hypothetical protein